MLVRVVQLDIQPEYIETFARTFDAHAMQIRKNPGCHSVQLLQEDQNPGHLATLSHWESQAALDAYRHSDFFKTLWSTVKPMFASKARAYSYSILA